MYAIENGRALPTKDIETEMKIKKAIYEKVNINPRFVEKFWNQAWNEVLPEIYWSLVHNDP